MDEIERLIRQGRNFEARNRAQEALKTSSDLRLSQLYAMAVSKSGAPQAAMEYLEPVYRQHADDPETAGILGGIYKELFKKDQNTKYALLSRDTYIKNFEATKSYYTGINAATMSAIAGQASRGRVIATEIISGLSVEAAGFWELATLAEASLLTKNQAKAIDFYFQARKMAGSDWGKINTVYNQLWLLNHYVPVPTEVLKVFSPPGVVAFVGHMIDHPSRTQPRFPESLEPKIKESIVSAIKTIHAHIGYCSLACGSDIIFAEAMTEAGGEVSAWLPFSKTDFIETSLRFAGEGWIQRFENLLNQSTVTFITEEAYEGYDDLFSFQSSVIFGSAVIRSSMSHTKPSLLTVLSETDLNRKEGGTRDTIKQWPYPDRHLNINPDNFLAQAESLPASTSSAGAKPSRVVDRPVLYVVCADLPDIPQPDQDKIWKSVQEKMEVLVMAPVTFEIKDALFATFNTTAGAIELSQIILDLIDVYHRRPKLRITLYASPTFLETDGDHKRLAPRSIERLTRIQMQIQPGTLYALARFASVLALDINKYSLDYAGVIPDGHRQHEIYSVSIH